MVMTGAEHYLIRSLITIYKDIKFVGLLKKENNYTHSEF